MYRYTETGLANVWLHNGYRIEKTPYGKGVAIEDADGLHRAIARRLVSEKPSLSGGEFRFLRRQLDLSQAALAEIIGKDAQSVARWEKSGRVPKMADRLLRAIWREHAEGNAAILKLVRKLGQLDRQPDGRLLFQRGRTWRLSA